MSQKPDKQKETDRWEAGSDDVTWGGKLFVGTLIAVLAFFWWLVIYSGGVVVHHG